VHVANLTRNARFESANPDEISSRGHVMIMHSPRAEVVAAGFYGLGRTDKSRRVGLDNPRGRYALHFHRTGTGGSAMQVSDVAVDGSPGWGVVNHSSNIDVSDSIVYDAVGSAFVSEFGDERGSFRGNLAIRMLGVPGVHPDNFKARQDIDDYGYSGHGFWLQSPTVALTDNVVSGAASKGIIYYPQPFGGASSPIQTTPIVDSGSTIYASRRGLRIYASSPVEAPSQVMGLTTWGLRYEGFAVDYSRNVELTGSRLIGSSGLASDRKYNDAAAIKVDHGPRFAFRDNYIVGFKLGVDAGYGGYNEVTGGYLNNETDLRIVQNPSKHNAALGVREVEISGVRLAGGGIQMQSTPTDVFWTQFTPERITWDGRRLYYAAQAAGHVIRSPLPEFDGLTNAELNARYGLAVAGSVMPADATTVPGLAGGYLGSAVPIGAGPLHWAARYAQPDGSVLHLLRDPLQPGSFITVRGASDFRPGWNIVWATDHTGVRRPGFFYIAAPVA